MRTYIVSISRALHDGSGEKDRVVAVTAEDAVSALRKAERTLRLSMKRALSELHRMGSAGLFGTSDRDRRAAGRRATDLH